MNTASLHTYLEKIHCVSPHMKVTVPRHLRSSPEAKQASHLTLKVGQHPLRGQFHSVKDGVRHRLRHQAVKEIRKSPGLVLMSKHIVRHLLPSTASRLRQCKSPGERWPIPPQATTSFIIRSKQARLYVDSSLMCQEAFKRHAAITGRPTRPRSTCCASCCCLSLVAA